MLSLQKQFCFKIDMFETNSKVSNFIFAYKN